MLIRQFRILDCQEITPNMSNGDVVPAVRRVHAVLVGFVTVTVFLLLYIGDLRASFRVSTQPRIVELLCPPKSYLFPMRIVEQLTMSTSHFLNLANVWNFIARLHVNLVLEFELQN